MKLAYNFSFQDLYNQKKLIELDQIFLQSLPHELEEKILELRSKKDSWAIEHSKVAIEAAKHLEEFIKDFFKIEIGSNSSSRHSIVYECKRNFVQRIAAKSSLSFDNIEETKDKLEKLISPKINEYNIEEFEYIFAEFSLKWIKENNGENIDVITKYALWAINTSEGIKKHLNGTLFKIPKKLNSDNLIKLQKSVENNIEVYSRSIEDTHLRVGFKLTDEGGSKVFAVDQANYCIHCHNRQKDSCSHGMSLENKGCPLDEKISEMNYLKSKGYILAPLAMAIVDNPMLAATGHRICNDCMKACIYQKQEPVDIPQVETRTLKDVLKLDWGFEIYSLLTRWNPLSFENPYPKENTNAKVLVAGMGPAGFTLAHYLLNEGHTVVGIDGLKIEGLSQELVSKPIKNINMLFEELDERLVLGFGGVMEYGITNRWNKNFLLLIRILLERRENFKLYGGVRLGSNITISQAFSLGFQHIALALGAGSPKLLDIDNSFAKGIRTASDFLMSLQLGKAYKKNSLTNIQIRMPIVVIGGGLTALDAATESLAYYPEMVKNFSMPVTNLTKEEKEVAEEYIEHARLLNGSDSQLEVMKRLGGVKILYRGSLQKAPSYRLNHEELSLGLSEGVDFIENIAPKEIILDEFGAVKAIKAVQNEREVIIPARTILIAAGTIPNVVLAEEFPCIIEKEGKYFKKLKDEFITYESKDGSISFIGDLHPDYAGNVVKAMASAKHSYKVISNYLKEDSEAAESFFLKMTDQLVATLIEINRLTPNIVELKIRSKLAAKNFKPGQFFRLQNLSNGKLPLMEPIALTGAKVEGDVVSLIVLEMGESSNLCAKLEIEDRVVLMGPTGSPTEIRENETVMLVGGGLGNAVLFSIGQELRAKNNKVIYFAGYRKKIDRYKTEEIEKAADKIIWSCDEGLLEKTREGDKSFKGNIVESIVDYAKSNPSDIKNIDRIVVIGSDKMMSAVKNARHTILKPYLKENHHAIASINSPMQCMMKEICGQCIQKHSDPITGNVKYVFSCTNQDQDMDIVDFIHLEARLGQNKLLEKVCKNY